MTSDLHAAVAAGLVGAAEDARRALLQSIVEVARMIFRAQAASITLLDQDADELVFAAVAGRGSDTLVGQRFPASSGIAGAVLATRQPLVIDDVAHDPRFARETAERTGYVPHGLMAAPLVADEDALGVLQVLDRPQRSSFSIAELDLLGQFANQAAIGLRLVLNAQRVQRVLAGQPDDLQLVARLAAALEHAEPPQRDANLALLAALERVIAPPR